MKSTLKIIVIALFTTLISCGETPKKEEATADPYSMQAVMAVHDEIMPKMGQIAKLSGQLKPLADANPEGPEAAVVMALKESHDAMMTWMKEIGETFTHEEIMKGAKLSEQKKEALKLEAEKIAEVKRLMLESIAKAEALLQ